MDDLFSLRLIVVLLAVLVLQARRGSAVDGEACDNIEAPRYVALECGIVPEDSEICSVDPFFAPGKGLDVCYGSRASCIVYTGLELSITCRVPGAGGVSVVSEDLAVFRDGERVEDNATWPFATSQVLGAYECQKNGTSFATRSVILDGRVFIIPYKGGMQLCLVFPVQMRDGVVSNYTCSGQYGRYNYFENTGGPLVRFGVVGARPIALSLDVVWVDHYPVTLDLRLHSSMALNDTLIHSAEVDFSRLLLVGQTSVKCYLVVTGTTANRSSSMCIPITFSGTPVLFPNTSQPENVSVVEGGPANFLCDVKVNVKQGFAFTVAIFVKLPASNFTECFNYSFTPSFVTNKWTLRTNDSCKGFHVTNSSSGPSLNRNHHLTASWPRPSLSLSGAEVLCAIASSGTTQWAKTATLTILPSLPPTPHSSAGPELRALAVISLLLLAALALLGGLIWWRYRRPSSQKLDETEIPLTATSLPSSEANTPTSSQHFLPTINLPPSSSSPQARLLQSLQQSSNSMDSGLGDLGVSNMVVSVATSQRSSSLNNLFFSPSREVCVYVSYCDSQADWVRETLLPLLHSFRPITVTDHEDHMIAGSVISEERLRLLQSADKVVAVVSPDYQLSEWCCYELQHVIQQSPAGAGNLIPILCGGCQELPSTIATLHSLSLDDPNWQHKLRVAIRRQHHHSN